SPIHRSCSSAMAASSTTRIDSSASGLIPIRCRTCSARSTRADSSISTPDSLASSMLTRSPHDGPGADARSSSPLGPFDHGARPGGHRLVVSVVRVDDVRHQPVPYHVGTGQPAEVDVVDAVQDVLDDPQPALVTGWKIDLRHVAGDDDLR